MNSMISASAIRLKLLVFSLLVAMAVCGCGVYFNTFFNAKKAFNSAEKARKKSLSGSGGRGDYQKAAEKALKVVENHPNSKYYDDALFVLAVSYYYTNQHAAAERRFRELLANYGESQFIKESKLYMAKAKLQLGDIDDAMVVFGEIFESDYDRDYKGEAATALGNYYFEQKQYEDSRYYYLSVRDSLGNENDQREAQIRIGDSYYNGFKFRDALGAYLQAYGMEPDDDEEYHLLYRAAQCSYQLQRIDDGLDYLGRLIENELYYDSLGILKLTVAQGYEYEDDLILAEVAYDDVASTTENRQWKSAGYYRLGLIYQFDYDQLEQAKEYYDKAVEANRNSETGQDALQRSSDIGKLETFARNPLDTSATQEIIDEAAYTQYLLAELYWFKLDKPDTAILELQYMIDSFQTAFYVPKALIALSQMYRDYYVDDEAADSILKLVLTEHSQSDYVPEALDLLGLRGTAADTGYASLYFHRAEDFLVDEENIDSARANYQYVVDNFSDSKYYLQSRFNLIWLTEMYDSPGDSSVIFAYQEFSDSFPGTDLARDATRRLITTSRQSDRDARRDQEKEEPAEEDTEESQIDTEGFDSDTSEGYIDPRLALYYRPNGDSLVSLKAVPIEIVEEFEFPAEAASVQQDDWRLFFQILVDYSGKVIDYILKIPSGIYEIDEQAILTVGSMTFDAMDISRRVSSVGVPQDPDGQGYWFVYEYMVSKPEHLR